MQYNYNLMQSIVLSLGIVAPITAYFVIRMIRNYDEKIQKLFCHFESLRGDVDKLIGEHNILHKR